MSIHSCPSNPCPLCSPLEQSENYLSKWADAELANVSLRRRIAELEAALVARDQFFEQCTCGAAQGKERTDLQKSWAAVVAIEVKQICDDFHLMKVTPTLLSHIQYRIRSRVRTIALAADPVILKHAHVSMHGATVHVEWSETP